MPIEIESTETQDEFDTAAAVADISADLFGQGSDGAVEGEKTQPEGEQPAESSSSGPVESAAAPQPEGENSQEVQEVGAPKTWTKEALADWATLPPRVQQEVLKREEDFLRGITQYKTAAEIGQRYDAVAQPYQAILQAENIDPVQLFQSFAANHYLLSKGTEDQKLQIAASLVDGYGIDFAKLIDYMGDRAVGAPDPYVKQLETRLAQLEGTTRQQVEAQHSAARSQVENEVSAFASDPAHPYFEEVSDDIAKLLNSGLATDLKDAYEKAVYANPVTRQKELDRLTAEARASGQSVAQTRVDKIARSTAADVKTIPTQRNSTIPRGSMDDTLAETLASIQSRG
jgi:hypothetical protein